VASLAVIGAVYQYSHAASPYVAVSPQPVPGKWACAVTDSGASGGSAVSFGAQLQ